MQAWKRLESAHQKTPIHLQLEHPPMMEWDDLFRRQSMLNGFGVIGHSSSLEAKLQYEALRNPTPTFMPSPYPSHESHSGANQESVLR